MALLGICGGENWLQFWLLLMYIALCSKLIYAIVIVNCLKVEGNALAAAYVIVNYYMQLFNIIY